MGACTSGLQKCFGQDGKQSGPKTGGTGTILERTGALRFLPNNASISLKEKYCVDSGKPVGEGAFGTVRKATKLPGKTEQVAIKTITKASLKGNVKTFVNECEIQAGMDHPNITKLFETFEDHSNVYLALEMATGGELFDEIEKQQKFSEADAATVMMQHLSGLTYMHGAGVAHRDLKPENFIFAERCSLAMPISKNILKIIDFGIAKRFESGVPMKTVVGTPYYLAPELLNKRYNEKCDVWSTGVILYILLSGAPPFYGEDQAIFKMAKKGLAPNQFNGADDFKGVTEEAKAFIRQMIVVDPKQRLSAKQAFSVPWVQKPHDVMMKTATLHLPKDLIQKFKKFSVHSKFKKAALAIVAHRIDDVKIKTLRETFMSFDKDGDGQINEAELIEGCANAGLDKAAARKVFESLDADNSGSVAYREFLAALIPDPDQAVLKEAFDVFDADGDGEISISELQRMVSDQAVGAAPSEEIVKMFKEADTDGSGQISFEEFCAMMRKKQ